MDLNYFIDRLTLNRAVFEGLLKGLTLDQARWKPSADKWSILEVVNHLYDEESEDFRQRLKILLESPQETWPPINPQEWVTSRGYNERELQPSLENFLAEREKSLQWLKTLKDPDWTISKERPTASLSAGDLVASWLAHDFLHIRQLTRLHWQYVGAISAPYETTYAGPWKES